MRLLKLLTPIVFAAWAVDSQAQQDSIVWLDYPEDGVVLGQGYNLLEDRVVYGNCVNFVPQQDPSQTVDYRFEEVNSTTEVKSKTSISASGSLKMAILKASARLSFLSDEKFKLDTTKFLLTARVTNSALFAAPSVGFKTGIKIPTGGTNKSPDEYSEVRQITAELSDIRNHEKCGHGFVAVIVSGAAIDAFLTSSKSNADALANIKGGLKADIAGIFSVSGSFEQRQESKKSQDAMSISMFRYGGAKTELAFDLPGLKSSLKQLVADAAATPKPIRIGVIPYRFLDTQVPLTGGYTADKFSNAVAGYFLAKDIFQRTSDIIDDSKEIPLNPVNVEAGDAPIFKARETIDYLELNSDALTLANRLSTLLLNCRSQIDAINDAMGSQFDSVSSQSDSDGKPEDVANSGQPKLTAEAVSLMASTAISVLGAPGTDVINDMLAADKLDIATTEKLFSDARDALTTLNVGSDFDADSLEACRVKKEDGKTSYLAEAPEMAIKLTAQELALRPIYWNELGARYQAEVRLANELQTPSKREAAIIEVLTDYNFTHRVTEIRRSICSFDFTHPICAADVETWIPLAKIDPTKVEIDLVQLDAELKQ